jgi:lipoprotein-anchoring transpeptidase ErfK/SrfK
MGRFYLPPQVIVVVAVLAAVGAILMVIARPAAGRQSPEPESAAAAARAPAEAVPVSAVDPVAEPEAPAAAPSAATTALRRNSGFLVLKPAPGHRIVVRSRPGGSVVARLGAQTEFGSPATLSVAARRGRWLGVVTTHLPNGKLGWVDPEESSLAQWRTRISVTVDLSARRLVVRRNGRALRRITVAVGRPETPTPRGRFAVTDKLPGYRYSSAYGCCILALSAHQTNLPSGWQGGDRIAVHGTNDPGSIGTAASAGCPRAGDADMRYLLRRVPRGAPVFIRA